MKAHCTCIALFCLLSIQTFSQSSYLDNYIGTNPGLTEIGNSADQLDAPRDLDFKPGTNELWVCNYADFNGGSMVLFFNAGLPNQTSQYRKDTHTDHFMAYPSALAFGTNGKWSATSEIRNSLGSPTATFMGPALWSGDTSLFAKVFQNNWIPGWPLGSHLDMLHQSPFAMGIAHDSADIYWVMDGHNGNIVKYDYVQDHGPGYDDHSAGKIWRYTDVTVTRVPQVPSHMVLDKETGWLYFIDGGSKKIKRLNTNTGTLSGNLTTPSTGSESLAGYFRMLGATVEDLYTFSTQPCGIDYYKGKLVVSDYTNGNIYLFNTTGTFALVDTLETGHPGMMGVKVGPDERIWCVNKTENKVYRLDGPVPVVDAAITRISSPGVESYPGNFYSINFDVCNGTIAPVVDIKNTGTTLINSLDINYTLDGGAAIPYHATGSFTPGSTASVTLPSSVVGNGNHSLHVNIDIVNGASDNVELNNFMHGSFRAFNAAVTLPFSEGFSSSGIIPPAGFQYVFFNPNKKITRASIGGFNIASGGSMKLDNWAGNVNTTGQKDYLLLPLLNFSTASTNTWMRFSVAYARYDASSTDGFSVLASSDCGSTWTTVYNKSGGTLATAASTTLSFTPTSAAQWRRDSVSLAAFAGQADVLIVLNTTSGFGNNLYVDDINIGDLSVGISNPGDETAVNIYPNPASASLHITAGDVFERKTEVSVFSFDGKLVKVLQIPAGEKSVTLDVSGLSIGMYALRLSNDQHIVTKLFTRQ